MLPSIDLTGKVALVTGGTRGIGQAISTTLALAGATVALNYRTDDKNARGFLKKLRKSKGKAFLVPGNVADFIEAESIVAEVMERTKRLDILINNAGIWDRNPLDHPRVEENWDRSIEINLKGTFNLCVHAVPFLKQSMGVILNVSSTAGQRGETEHSHYAAAKGGIISLTKSLATELGPYGIRVNCIAPGWVETEATEIFLSKKKNKESALRNIPLRKIAKPQDIAPSALFLCSPWANHITGEVLNINGGSVLCS